MFRADRFTTAAALVNELVEATRAGKGTGDADESEWGKNAQ
jgi:hypothetical protein